ncbi:MAG: zf-HC2 domain-containing protein [Gammaproteobacteria bacterium]|nr:zf-HC2 domain-containing protein [Gammaproteobacteria bacterium]
MKSSDCQSPVVWDSLLAYWLGELDAEREAQVEEHYLGCEPCSRRLQQLVALAQQVRDLTRTSGVSVVINEPFVQRLVEQGMHVREYYVPLNGAVNCTVAPEDDFVVAYLKAPLEGVQQLDMIYLDGDDDNESGMRLHDIPFTADSGTVVFSTGIDALRALPTTTLRVRLLAIDNNGERSIGDYTFNHKKMEPSF